MLFYVPPLLPVLARVKDGSYEVAGLGGESLAPLLGSLERARMPVRYMASLFAAGNEQNVTEVFQKLIAVRAYKSSQYGTGKLQEEIQQALSLGNTTAEEVEAIYRLTALPTYEERFVVPPMGREIAIGETLDPYKHKPAAGFGFRQVPKRGA